MTNLTETETMQETMRAIVQDEYGLPDVLELREVPKPVVGDDQIMVEVRASSVNAAEWHMVTGTPYLVRPAAGWLKPKKPIPGADVAGTVVGVGKDVSKRGNGSGHREHLHPRAGSRSAQLSG